jgi:soluble lytic murein transglycosylase-like protein
MAIAIRQPPPPIASALDRAAAQTGVPADLLRAVAWVESRYSPKSVSGKGAMGLLQLMPKTAASLGVSDPFDPVANALGGARELAALFKTLGSWDAAFAAYNWGIGRVRESPNPSDWPAQVRGYVANINSAWRALDPSASVVPARAGSAHIAIAALGVLAVLVAVYGIKSSGNGVLAL